MYTYVIVKLKASHTSQPCCVCDSGHGRGCFFTVHSQPLFLTSALNKCSLAVGSFGSNKSPCQDKKRRALGIRKVCWRIGSSDKKSQSTSFYKNKIYQVFYNCYQETQIPSSVNSAKPMSHKN